MELYPPAPWMLHGWGIGTMSLVDSAAAAKFVPIGAHLVTIVPGKTIGGLFFLCYDDGTLRYRELNVVAGLVRIGRRFAFLLARLFVDSPASLAGGREIWGVPKVLATFEIDRADGYTSIAVREGSRAVCRLRYSSAGSRQPRIPLVLPAFGMRDDAFLFFSAKLKTRMTFVRAEVELPADGEFAKLTLDRPGVTARCDDLTLVVPLPRIVARPSSAQQAAASRTDRAMIHPRRRESEANPPRP